MNPVTTDPALRPILQKLRELVLAKRPILAGILAKHGNKSIDEYTNEYVDVNMNPAIPRRQEELLTVVREFAEERYNKQVADSVIQQLQQNYFVSTADHTGPTTHPFFVNSNMLIGLPIQKRMNKELENIIVFSCSNVSINNSSWPRGPFFHTVKDGELKTHRLSLFSANHRGSVYHLPAYGKAHIQKIYDLLKTKLKDNELTKEMHDQVRELFASVYDHEELFSCSNYSQQVGKTNVTLWNKFFEKSGTKLPRLVYLDQEEMVVRLLTKFHLDQDTVINHMLFDNKYVPYVTQYFEGIFGCFSERDDAGTYLFWARSADGNTNVQLWRRDGMLQSKDGTYKVALTPEAIRTAMEKKEIIPNLLLNFSVLSFYYGLKCLGGFNQVNYLTLMKNAYIKMNADLGNYRSIEMCARAQTKEICDGPTIAFLGYGDGHQALASGFDLALYGTPDSWSTIQTIAKSITLEESIAPLYPEIYRISYDKSEWDEDVVKIGEKEVMNLTGLDTRMPPCVRIP